MPTNESVNDTLMRHLTRWKILDTPDTAEFTSKLREACSAVQASVLACIEAKREFDETPVPQIADLPEGPCMRCSGQGDRVAPALCTDDVLYYHAARLHLRQKASEVRRARRTLATLLQEGKTIIAEAPDKFDVHDQPEVLRMNWIFAQRLAWAAEQLTRNHDSLGFLRVPFSKLVRARYESDKTSSIL